MLINILQRKMIQNPFLFTQIFCTYTYSVDAQNWPYDYVYNNMAIVLFQIVPDL